MEIVLDHIGKRFNREWIFKDVSLKINSGDHLAILGANGSGKSTLLQILSGYLTPSTGAISWKGEKNIPVESIYSHISIATPYMNLFDDFTLQENLTFHTGFKKTIEIFSIKDFAAQLGLEKQLPKQLKFFSSGMKQRVKLGTAILSNSEILLLDEPCSHLDNSAITWYQELLKQYSKDRIILIASNRQESETYICTKEIQMEHYKSDPRIGK